MAQTLRSPLPATPLSDTAAALVRAEVDRILNHPLFGHSKRYPALLRYVVDRTLQGREDELKERTVGIEALGRTPSYDTAQDPVVRTTAAEVRKRLAQYYQEIGSTGVCIHLPVGSYVPRFEFVEHAAVAPQAPAPPETSPTVALQPPLQQPTPPQPQPVWLFRAWRNLALGLTAIAAVSAGVYALWPGSAKPPIERFWEPILSAEGTVGVCVGRAGGTAVNTAGELVTMNAATATSRVVGVLNHHGKLSEVKPAQAVDFFELRSHPMVAVGGFNNKWTLSITGALRFRFRRTDTRQQIVDSADQNAVWEREMDLSVAPQTVIEDFAIVARVRDASSGQHVMALGGIGMHGTAAAGEFVTSPEYLRTFAESAPAGWERKNIELVIATKVRDGVAGPPRVVASHYWE